MNGGSAMNTSDTITLTIDGRNVTVPVGTTMLNACRAAGVKIPTLCHLEGISSNASCGICVVEVEGARNLVRSCVQTAAAGQKILTSSARVMEARRTVVELLLANHPDDCLSCLRNGTCELQSISELIGVKRKTYPMTRKPARPDLAGRAILRDNNKCILCGRCVAVCRDTQTVSAIDFTGRGIRSRVAPFMDRALSESTCVSCGQCTLVCPTGALTERDETDEVFAAIHDPDLTVIVQTAPAIRASLGEALGMPAGSLVTGKMVSALSRIGFNKVFDTQFTADLTIMEEGTELLSRLTGGGTLPMITSCSPGWISFIETFYPQLLPHLSTCKSPQQMFGALAKSWWAERTGIDPSKLVVVSIMPCTAKKFEAKRPEMRNAWEWWKEKDRQYAPFFDVDYALTTRELARMIKRNGIDFADMPDSAFDSPLGTSTGAATIFGSTGGVMEAALRTTYELATGTPLPTLELQAVRGFEGIREASLDINGAAIKVAVAHSLANARVLLDGIAAGTSPYTFIEVMSCPGGCLGGGGQPLAPDWQKKSSRQAAIYTEDRNLPIRKSHENPDIGRLYQEFLEKPSSHQAHSLLHTTYRQKTV